MIAIAAARNDDAGRGLLRQSSTTHMYRIGTSSDGDVTTSSRNIDPATTLNVTSGAIEAGG
jgi:hypothetical protein